jgi:hypothetical protein
MTDDGWPTTEETLVIPTTVEARTEESAAAARQDKFSRRILDTLYFLI